MNRIFFLVGLIIWLTIHYWLISLNSILINVISMTISLFILVSLRRHFLKIKPWWGGDLEDIPKYFQKP